MLSDGELILVAGALLAAGWLASLIAERFRLPALVLFLGLGMAIGSDGTDWIDFEDYALARRIGVITAAAILFEAGLAAGVGAIRPVLRPAVSLATARPAQSSTRRGPRLPGSSPRWLCGCYGAGLRHG